MQDERAALETVRFIFSELARETYFGHGYTCGQTVQGTCHCLAFTDQLNARIKIWYDNTDKQVKRAQKLFDPNPNTCSSSDKWVPFTDNAVSVTNLSFELESDITKQPRVQARIDAEYVIDSSTKQISFKTQITSRILEPGQNILSTFTAGSENENSSVVHHYAYGPRMDETGQYLDENGAVVANPEDAEIVCRDGSGGIFVDSFCEESTKISAAEFTIDGLYILGENGLLFFIPQASIDEAITASGSVGAKNPVYKESSGIQSTVVRVLGKSGLNTCRFCSGDPRSIVSIHPAADLLYARSYNGALYKVDDASATRIVEGGTSKNTVRHISSDANRVLIYFRNAVGNRTARLFSGNTSISSGDISGGCSEFAFVPSNTPGNRCRQIYPDPDIHDGDNIEPEEVKNISFRFLDALQVINDTVSLWYRDSIDKYVVSVGSGTAKLKRSDEVADGTIFAYGNGLNKYTTVCSGGTSLCIIDSILDTTPTEIAISDTSPFTDHLHFKNLPIAINENGRLVYFSGVTASDTATVVSVYNKNETPTDKQRILCDTTVESDQQVVFKRLSDKHPTKDIVAAVGTSLIAGYVDEIHLLEPTTTAKEQYSGRELNTVCSDTDHVERYHLPTTTGPSGGLDLVRLHGIEFWDRKPKP